MGDRPQDCFTRTMYATISGGAFGMIMGALGANWGEAPQVVRNKSWPAFKQTGAVMASQGALFAALGAAFAAGDCAAESFRGKHDMWNGVWGGFASGAVIGLRFGSPAVAVGSGTALAVMSAIVDTTGQKLKGDGLFDDGLTPAPKIYPYPKGPVPSSDPPVVSFAP